MFLCIFIFFFLLLLYIYYLSSYIYIFAFRHHMRNTFNSICYFASQSLYRIEVILHRLYFFIIHLFRFRIIFVHLLVSIFKMLISSLTFCFVFVSLLFSIHPFFPFFFPSFVLFFISSFLSYLSYSLTSNFTVFCTFVTLCQTVVARQLFLVGFIIYLFTKLNLNWHKSIRMRYPTSSVSVRRSISKLFHGFVNLYGRRVIEVYITKSKQKP